MNTPPPSLSQCRVELCGNGVAYIVFDAPGRTMDVFSEAAIPAIGLFACWLEQADIGGAIDWSYDAFLQLIPARARQARTEAPGSVLAPYPMPRCRPSSADCPFAKRSITCIRSRHGRRSKVIASRRKYRTLSQGGDEVSRFDNLDSLQRPPRVTCVAPAALIGGAVQAKSYTHLSYPIMSVVNHRQGSVFALRTAGLFK